VAKPPKKNKTKDTIKNLEKTDVKGLFDHINHIQKIQDPNYYSNLSESDRKSWSNFMILRALSMDQDFIEYSADLFKFFDIIPPEAMYKILIGLVDKNRKWSPWIKSKKIKFPSKIINFVANHFEISTVQSEQYIKLYFMIDGGKDYIKKLMSEYGYEDKEISKMFKGE
jgi:hypothetical protein